jgi:hypothetical protein
MSFSFSGVSMIRKRRSNLGRTEREAKVRKERRKIKITINAKQ